MNDAGRVAKVHRASARNPRSVHRMLVLWRVPPGVQNDTAMADDLPGRMPTSPRREIVNHKQKGSRAQSRSPSGGRTHVM